MYVCLEFGFEGRFRIVDGGQRQLEAIRQRLLQIIRKQRGEYERDLSPNWRGLGDVAQRRLGWLPLWVVGAVTAVALVGIYVGFDWQLGEHLGPARGGDRRPARRRARRAQGGGRAAAGDVPPGRGPARARQGRRPCSTGAW